jgi:HAD superfamily hydrolase (TIGR01662 family)
MNNESIKDIKLLILDVDGTIAAFESNELWEVPKDFFREIWRMKHKPFIALASNQGGVGLRYWMEENDFGEPSKYPTEDDVRQRMHLISESVRRLSGVDEIAVYMAFMYQAKSTGNWSPMKANKSEWHKSSRKPAPGMLLRAMNQYSILGDQTLMVGDWEEDEDAARRAGCHFMYTSDFFYSDGKFDPMSVLAYNTVFDVPF